MKITNVRVTVLNNSKVKGLASLEIDEIVVLNDIKILDGKNGLFVAMPSRPTKDGEYKDVFFIKNKDAREKIFARILKDYTDQLEQLEQDQKTNGDVEF